MPVRGPHNLVKYGSYQADAGLSVSVWNRLSTPKFGREQRWDPDVHHHAPTLRGIHHKRSFKSSLPVRPGPNKYDLEREGIGNAKAKVLSDNQEPKGYKFGTAARIPQRKVDGSRKLYIHKSSFDNLHSVASRFDQQKRFKYKNKVQDVKGVDREGPQSQGPIYSPKFHGISRTKRPIGGGFSKQERTLTLAVGDKGGIRHGCRYNPVTMTEGTGAPVFGGNGTSKNRFELTGEMKAKLFRDGPKVFYDIDPGLRTTRIRKVPGGGFSRTARSGKFTSDKAKKEEDARRDQSLKGTVTRPNTAQTGFKKDSTTYSGRRLV